jgi:hypothetical protein
VKFVFYGRDFLFLQLDEFLGVEVNGHVAGSLSALLMISFSNRAIGVRQVTSGVRRGPPKGQALESARHCRDGD